MTDFTFDYRDTVTPFVAMIWRTWSEHSGGFTSVAGTHWEMVITRYEGKTTLTVRGPETKASPAPIPAQAQFLGIVFNLGTYMPHLPGKLLVNQEINLPAAGKGFWLYGEAWPFPDYDNADVFIQRLMRKGLLAYDPLIPAVLAGKSAEVSLRSIQRHFLHATGLTQKTIQQIQRAQEAVALLEKGVSILDTAFQLGCSDQAHLTNALRRLMGQTPGQILRLESQANKGG